MIDENQVEEVSNQELREIFEALLLAEAVPYVDNFMNLHSMAVNPVTDNYIDFSNEVAFNIFKQGYLKGAKA